MTLQQKRKGLKRVWGQITKERAEYEALLIAALARLHSLQYDADQRKKFIEARDGWTSGFYFEDGCEKAFIEMLTWLQTEYNKLKLR